jgi:hypothetical protein
MPGAAYVFCDTCLQGMYSTGGNLGGLAADTECKLCPSGTTAGPGAFTLANCTGKRCTARRRVLAGRWIGVDTQL